MAVIAEYFGSLFQGGRFVGGVVPKITAWTIVALHLVAGPILLPLRARGIEQVAATLGRAFDTVPSDASIRDKTAIYVNPPADPFASFLPITRAALGIPRPLRQRWLTTGVTAATFERLDARTLRVEPEGGFLVTPSERLLTGAGRPLGVGARVDLGDFSVEVTRVTEDGRPAEVKARFARDLEDPSYVWLVWRNDGYEAFAPPAIGESAVVPAVDLLRVSFGPNSPVTALFSKGARSLGSLQ
jgi:hypothetical protein